MCSATPDKGVIGHHVKYLCKAGTIRRLPIVCTYSTHVGALVGTVLVPVNLLQRMIWIGYPAIESACGVLTLERLAWPSLVNACTAKAEEAGCCAEPRCAAAECLCDRLSWRVFARLGACSFRAALLAKASNRGSGSASPRAPASAHERWFEVCINSLCFEGCLSDILCRHFVHMLPQSQAGLASVG